MHRQISHIDETLRPRSNAGLYFLTALVGLLIGLDLFWPAVARWLGPVLGVDLPTLAGGLRLAGTSYRLALVAAVLGGARVLYGALESLLSGKLGADLALAVAVVAAILINEPLVAAEVVFIGLVGECLEAITFERTQRAVRRLVEICPRLCLVLRDGQEVRTPVEDVRAGERVLVRPGKRVPVDGVVVDGRSAVDQSTLTGESLPLDKGVGDEVFAGTLNQHGALIVEVRRVAEHTVVGRVMELTARALKDKAPLERTADRWARYFLPVVLGLALVTFLANLWWFRGTAGGLYQAVYPALAVLVVACPCALILATPATVIAALGRLAGTGVLIKGGAALERLAAVDAIAFDKTGTLTRGEPRLGEIHALVPELDEAGVLRLAAAAEKRSEHILARMLVEEASRRGITLPEVEDFEAHPGFGVTARILEGSTQVGNARFLREQGLELPPEAEAILSRLDAAGQTPLLVARDGRLAGILGARDSLRPEAPSLFRELAALGITHTALLTGDRRPAALEVARTLGIDEVQAELLPDQKAAWIESWRQKGRTVAMVGDGINDAPALATAQVGLALGGVGADIAAEAGDVVLMANPLGPLPFLIRLARQSVKIIRQNILFFAFGVNAVGVLLAGWILPAWSETARQQSPIWAAIYHQIGSLAVLLNAMRLLWFERGKDYAALRGLAAASRRVDDWLEHVSLHDAVHWLERHARGTAAALGAVILGLYLLTCVAIIQPGQVGVVTRFGRPVADLDPGLHLRLPWPWEQVARIRPREPRSVDVGFRNLGPPGAGPGSLTWSSPHGDGQVRQRDEALMITGDGSLVEVQASVYYTIDEPRTFLFDVASPEETLRALAESVFREVIAERTFLELLSRGREEFQREVVRRLRDRCRREYPLGIQLESVAVLDLHPPQEVVEAYYEVTRALSQKERLLTEAQRGRETEISREEAARLRLLAGAQGKYVAAVQASEAERDAYLALAATLHGDSFQGFFLPGPPGIAWLAALQLIGLEIQNHQDQLRQLVEFRAYLEAAEQILGGRPKVLRDPRLQGQVTVVPEILKVRVPLLNREPPPRGRGPREEEP